MMMKFFFYCCCYFTIAVVILAMVDGCNRIVSLKLRAEVYLSALCHENTLSVMYNHKKDTKFDCGRV